MLASLTAADLQGLKVVVFDTRVNTKGSIYILINLVAKMGYADPKIQDVLKKIGARLTGEPLGLFVNESERPFAEGELERAAAWAKTL